MIAKAVKRAKLFLDPGNKWLPGLTQEGIHPSYEIQTRSIDRRKVMALIFDVNF